MENTQQGISIADKPPKPDPDVEAKNALVKIGKKFVVMSGKGGVGKTSVSVNLSIALANMGFKVGLMDVDVHGPDIPRMLGLKGMLTANENKKIRPMRYSDNLSAVSTESLMTDKDNAVIWRGPLKHAAIRQFIGDVDWGNLDFMVIDSPPGTGDEPLTVAQLINDASAIIVTTPQEVALADVRKSINFCRTLKMGILGLIENMSGLACPHCGEAIEIFGSGGGQATAKAADIPFLGKIPFDPQMVACGDAGESYQDKNRDTVVTKTFTEIAARMARQ
ncbi:Mrp/NBP35 family ATP-binding protein [Desulfococcaceae bacterium HSG9]|nr:Mrp/NBP35 family ATP-binding protein [Desulfococcaceae bacterium HSG9]